MKIPRQFTLPLFLFGLVATYNQSCCGGDCDDEPIDTADTNQIIYDTLFLNDTFMNYWFFPEGSWWVYKRIDSNTIEYDTAIVTYTNREFHYPRYGGNLRWENAQLKIEHSSKHIISTEKFSGYNELYLSVQQFDFLHGFGAEGTQLGFSVFFSWPYNIGSVGGGKTAILDTPRLFVPTLNDTIRTIHSAPYYGLPASEKHVWFAKNIGFVKFIFKNGTEWILVDYFINK